MFEPDNPVILVYAEPLLAASLKFVLSQGEALERFVPYYVGPHQLRRGGLRMPTGRTMALSARAGFIGKLREMPYRRFGCAPIYLCKLRKLRPLLMHAHFGPCGLRALSLSDRLGIPLVTTIHGFDATVKDSVAEKLHYGSRDYVRRKSVLRERGRLFIAVSQFVRDKMLEQGFPEDKVVTHYIGVDTGFFWPDRQVQREPVVLFTGRLNEQKGCEYLILAMARVQALMPEIDLVIIGEGTDSDRLKKLAQEKLKRFRFLGSQPPCVVKQWMNRAKVFSVPCVTVASGAEEGFGLVFAEAQAMGCPVASFSSGGIPEAVAHGKTGLLARERDAEALSQNILLILQREDLWKEMSDASRNRALALFDLKIQTKRLEELYCQVLSKTSGIGGSVSVPLTM